jgi:hypothetical protein
MTVASRLAPHPMSYALTAHAGPRPSCSRIRTWIGGGALRNLISLDKISIDLELGQWMIYTRAEQPYEHIAYLHNVS